MAQTRLMRSQSTAGRRICSVELERIETSRQLNQEMGINNITADAIEMTRARLLLLGEPPQLNERSAQSLVSGFVTMVGQDRIDGSTFPKLWVDSSGDLVKFLRFARLSAVFWLKKTNACQAIRELCLGPIVSWAARKGLVRKIDFHRSRRRLFAGADVGRVIFQTIVAIRCCFSSSFWPDRPL
jgi:hypothetical protein